MTAGDQQLAVSSHASSSVGFLLLGEGRLSPPQQDKVYLVFASFNCNIL